MPMLNNWLTTLPSDKLCCTKKRCQQAVQSLLAANFYPYYHYILQRLTQIVYQKASVFYRKAAVFYQKATAFYSKATAFYSKAAPIGSVFFSNAFR